MTNVGERENEENKRVIKSGKGKEVIPRAVYNPEKGRAHFLDIFRE
jgi:hypothetical protein